MRYVSLKSCILSALALIALLGCVSLPVKTDQDECLVVIRTAIENQVNAPLGRKYELHFTSNYAPAMVPTLNEGYVAIVVKEPGVSIDYINTFVPSNTGMTGDKAVLKQGMDLPYAPGKLVIADRSFVQTVREDGQYRYIISAGFQDTTEKEKAALLKKLQKDKNYSAWTN